MDMPFVRGNRMRGLTVVATKLSVLALGACGGIPNPLGGKSKARPAGSNAAAIGVNGYLWRATLDTLAFMPLQSADPYGGLIITEWWSPPESQNERFKATIYILDTRLRADGLNVSLQKQVRGTDGTWRDAAASPQSETDLENAILTKARQLRVNGRG
jgi:hypothetical protein